MVDETDSTLIAYNNLKKLLTFLNINIDTNILYSPSIIILFLINNKLLLFKDIDFHNFLTEDVT